MGPSPVPPALSCTCPGFKCQLRAILALGMCFRGKSPAACKGYGGLSIRMCLGLDPRYLLPLFLLISKGFSLLVGPGEELTLS